ncbi:MAG: MptD family putative ECF transporter S component [Oscillospiraceae bacterium]|nr:MptD family putative ECF transporter S component [Oscillospiraceae bacterium]
MKDTENKLTGKDLMYIGIYGAIYYVIVFIVAMLGMIPIMYPMLAVICPIVGGIPFMLFLTKVKKFGMIWILSVLMGLMMLISGMGWYALAMSAITGLVSELIYKSGNYQSAKSAVITNGTFSLWVWANLLQLFINRTEFLSSRESKVGAEYVEKLNALTPDWICPVLLGICFVSGIVGGLIGKAMLSKHFKKAGIV